MHTTGLTSPYFDQFADFEWDRWQDQAYRESFIQRLMLRLGKYEWLKRKLPSSSFPYHHDVFHLAVLHGLPTSQAMAFQQAWSNQKEILGTKKLNIEKYESRDWISIATFDKCAAHLIRDSQVCKRLAQLASLEPLGPHGQWIFLPKTSSPTEEADMDIEMETTAPAPPPRHLSLPSAPKETSVTVLHVEDSQPPSLAQPVQTLHTNEVSLNHLSITSSDTAPSLSPIVSWTIPECKKLEHVRLLRSIGHERGNYIGQVGPCEFKFGLTEKDFGARTDQHTKDFDKFCLVWAQHCFNSTRAEALFKKDPRIQPRLVKKTTAKNRHREIIQIDTMCTEAVIKEIYSSYVQQVNEQETAKFGASTAVTSSLRGVFSPPQSANHDGAAVAAAPHPASSSDHISLEREKLEFEKEKWRAEIKLREAEIELQKQQMQYQSTAADAATILSRIKQYTSPTELPGIPKGIKIDGSKTIGQVSPITNQVIRQFSNIYQTQQNCLDLRLNRKHLVEALDLGKVYRGFKWIRL